MGRDDMGRVGQWGELPSSLCTHTTVMLMEYILMFCKFNTIVASIIRISYLANKCSAYPFIGVLSNCWIL